MLLTVFFFFFNATATTEIYTLSLHDALPISRQGLPDDQGLHPRPRQGPGADDARGVAAPAADGPDRKSTRLNSSHTVISYAVFCLKKKTSRSLSRGSDCSARRTRRC